MRGTIAYLALAGLAASLAGCVRPGIYHDTKSGTIANSAGMPLPGTYVFTRVFKECGSVGGRVHQSVSSSFVVTNETGRYSRSVSGVGLLYLTPLAGCAGFKIEDWACRSGYGCSLIDGDGNASLRPNSGVNASLFDLPPLIAASVSGCQQKRWAQPLTRAGWETGVKFGVLWYCSPDPAPLADVTVKGANLLIAYESVNHGSSPVAVTARWISTTTYSEPEQAPGRALKEVSSVSLFALAEHDGVLRPVGGIRWGYGLGSGMGVQPSPPEALDRSAWSNMLQYARGQIPLEELKRLPNIAPPP